MAGARNHEWPGTMPGPRRARTGGQDSAASARGAGNGTLAWSVAAMCDALRRLAGASAANVPQAVAATCEAAWWVTVVDAAMTRHHPDVYGRALTDLDPAARRAVAGIPRRLTGSSAASSGTPPIPATSSSPPGPAGRWTWSVVSPPYPQRGSAREASPYRDYRAQLAGKPVAAVLEQAAGFLCQAYASTTRPGE